MAIELFKEQMRDNGWYCFSDFINTDLVARMTNNLEQAYTRCRKLQVDAGLDKTGGTCHHLIGQGDSFAECMILYEDLDEYFTAYFGGKYILNSMGGNILSKGMSYANEIHRDIRSYSGGLPLMLNTIVLLDDFTEENGATWLREGGHRWKDKPSEQEFMANAFQIIGKAGTVYVWNSNLWHRAGENKTDGPRRSLTPELVRPFMKQGYDYTQFVNEQSSPWLKQILGWNSRIPSTLEDWYQPKEKRFYLGDQG